MMLVTLYQASAHVRRDTDADDADLVLKIKAASRAVLGYIDADSWTDSAGEPIEDSDGIALNVPEDVQFATLLLVAHWYRERSGDMGNNAVPSSFGYGYLPLSVTALLYRHRTPTVR